MFFILFRCFSSFIYPGVSLFSKHVHTVRIAFSRVFSMHDIPI